MGTFIKGILGGFSGLVGTVVGANWRGIDYMRSRPRKSAKPPTEAQLKQQMSFALVAGFLRPISNLIKIGYQSYKGRETPMNAASAYHLKHAVTGIYPDLSIDFPEVVFSKGNLLAAFLADVESAAVAQAKFNWTDNAPAGSAAGTDRATVLVYNPDKDQFVTLSGAAARSAETYTLILPVTFSGDTIKCWISFVSVNGKEVSDSVYIGSILVL